MASLVANIRRSTTEWLHRRENSENRAREAEFLPFFLSPVSEMSPVCRDRVWAVPRINLFFLSRTRWVHFPGGFYLTRVRHGYLANFGVTVQHRNYQARNVRRLQLT
ncbi:hypothetical protein ACB092_07G174600 [Castanea dentata]